jgi:hypothetical protein
MVLVSGCSFFQGENVQTDAQRQFDDKCSFEVLTNYKRSGRELPKAAMVRAYCSAQFAAVESGIVFEKEKAQ